MKVMVTGGAGFIGSAVCRLLIGEFDAAVLNVENLTYVCGSPTMSPCREAFDPDTVLHLAAESHVDRSIDGPAEFIKTNVEGTCVLLEAALDHWRRLPGERAAPFRFTHV